MRTSSVIGIVTASLVLVACAASPAPSATVASSAPASLPASPPASASSPSSAAASQTPASTTQQPAPTTGAAEPTAAASASAPPPEPVVQERDGVVVSMELDRASIPPGGRVWARIRVRNTNREAVLWQGGGCDHPASVVGTTAAQPVDAGRAWPGELGIVKSVALANVAAGAEPYLSSFVEQSQVDKENAGCTDDLAIRELPGGAALQFVGAWDARMQSGYPLVPGPVDVKASFPFIALKSAVPGGDPFSVEARPITLTGGFEIAGEAAPKVVSPGVAADAALADARFVDWLRRHPQREWSSADLRLRDGAWTLRVGLQGGAEGSVLVDPVSGAVVAVDLP